MAAKKTRSNVIFHVLHHDGEGGGPRCVIDLLDSLSEYKQIVLTGGNGCLSRHCRQNGIKYYNILSHSFCLLPYSMIKAAVLMLKYKPSTVILMGQWAALFASPIAWILRRKLIIYVVQYSFLYNDTDLFRLIRNRFIEKISCIFSDRVIFLSPGNRYQYLIRNLLPFEKSYLIPNSLNPNRVPSVETACRLKRELGWNNELCHVLSIGRLEDQKRVDWLIKSWALVEKECYSAKLWIVGSGKEENKLKSLAISLNLKNCHFLGNKDNGINYICACDIVAMTSMYEMHALVPLEAMACGKPIVASCVDGVRSTFRDNVEGFQVPPGDIKFFARALITLINDKEKRERMGKAGKIRVREFYPEKTICKYKQIIKEYGVGLIDR